MAQILRGMPNGPYIDSKWLHAHPEDERAFIFKVMNEARARDVQAGTHTECVKVLMLMQERFRDKYTEEHIKRLWDIAWYLSIW